MAWLMGGVIPLLIFLGYFKYANFFIESINAVFHLKSSALNIILPLGVSFYIFSALSYLIDVYRREFAAERNYVNFALYISFFPKLLAGPIVRGNDFLPQLNNYRGIHSTAFLSGIQIFVFGLFKKLVLADHLGVFVDDVFYSPSAFSSATVWLAVISYSLQIYFDFSGYSDMAIGTAKMLGIDFKPNFDLPYISENVSDFWKRWHISLSTWFRDYLYIPLGGNRKGELRTYINLFVVMLVSGLWHGAGYMFLLWGAMHGFACCLHKLVGKRLFCLGRIVNALLTFILVSLFWVVFRADSVATACKVYKALIVPQSGIFQPYTWSFFAIACLGVSSLVAFYHDSTVEHAIKTKIHGFYPVMDLTRFWPKVAFLVVIGLVILLGYFGDTSFIYGAF